MVILRFLASLTPYRSLTRLLTVSWMSSSTPRSCLDDLRSSLDWAVARLNWRRAESRSSSLRLELDMAELGLESGLMGLDIEDTRVLVFVSGDFIVIVSGVIGFDIGDMVLVSGDIKVLVSEL